MNGARNRAPIHVYTLMSAYRGVMLYVRGKIDQILGLGAAAIKSSVTTDL